MPHSICAVFDARRQHRKRLGRIIARLHLQRRPIDGAAIEPRRRSGFQACRAQSPRVRASLQGPAPALRRRGRREFAFADVDEAAQECAGGQNHDAAGQRAAIGEFDAADAAILRERDRRPRLRHVEIGRCADRRLHRLRVELAVGLGARAAHGGTFAPVEHAELDAAVSATRPMRPSRASISRTRWPLPRPPMAGLHDIAPMVAIRCVTRAVLAPMRALAAAASQPAWPPPMTMTSNRVFMRPQMGPFIGGGRGGQRNRNSAKCFT